MQNKDKETFSYTYSAKEQAEIQKIRDKYEKPTAEEDKMTQLRRLDASVHSKATAVALVLGIIGALIMGCGMSLIMTDIGAILGAPSNLAMLIGVPIGIVGMVLVCLAYPVYNRTVKKEREKIAPEIIRLADELMK
ncbi:MAG: hypothetical protein IJF21_05605 [Clostridia bacterium]|nr:hypothetical protein [Clostridia bacterium]MBQ3227650.1 hypothetical protein [Clostridia bacterium]